MKHEKLKATVLITGSTDGIGKATAEALVDQGHRVLIHGRNQAKLDKVKAELSERNSSVDIDAYSADLSDSAQVKQLASTISAEHKSIDVLINNAGVFKVPNKNSDNGIDIRFAVNTIAPYLLTLKLLERLGASGRVVNLSSAAQDTVDTADIEALGEANRLSDNNAYAQSKLALTMWSRYLAEQLGDQGPAIIAVNPASFLGSNMVKEAYGQEGKDLQIGVDILIKASLSDEFSAASGLYYDNDKGAFSAPHPDALDPVKNKAITDKIEKILRQKESA